MRKISWGSGKYQYLPGNTRKLSGAMGNTSFAEKGAGKYEDNFRGCGKYEYLLRNYPGKFREIL